MIHKRRAYRVRDWDIHFETSESRKRRSGLAWIALPTRFDGKRIRRLAKLDQAPLVYAGWTLIVAVAARCPQRGLLVDDRGDALAADDLALMTGFPAEVFTLAFDVLTDPAQRIQWLESVDLPADACDLPERAGVPADPSRSQHAVPESAGVPATSSPTLPNPTQPNITQHHQTQHDITGQNPDLGLNPFSGGLAGLGVIDPGDADRYMGVQGALTRIGVEGVTVKKELCGRKDITVKLIEEIWRKVQADAAVENKVAVLVHRLRKHRV